MKAALPFLLGGLLAVGGNGGNVRYDRYCNARFGQCVDVPSFLRAVTDPANGNGRVFRSRDERGELRSFGSKGPAALGLSTAGVYRQQLGRLKRDKLKVSAAALGPDFFVISGSLPDGRIYYQKSIVCAGSEYALTLLSPAANRALWDKVTLHVSASLSAPKKASCPARPA